MNKKILTVCIDAECPKCKRDNFTLELDGNTEMDCTDCGHPLTITDFEIFLQEEE